MTDTPDPWKDFELELQAQVVPRMPPYVENHLMTTYHLARASSDAQTRQQVEDAFQAGFNRGRQEKCDGRH